MTFKTFVANFKINDFNFTEIKKILSNSDITFFEVNKNSYIK